MEPISKTIDTLLKKWSLEQKSGQQAVCDAFMQTLSNKEKRHMRAWGLRGSVLMVHVDSPAWMYALNLKKASLLKGLQDKLGKDVIRDIKLKIGKAG